MKKRRNLSTRENKNAFNAGGSISEEYSLHLGNETYSKLEKNVMERQSELSKIVLKKMLDYSNEPIAILKRTKDNQAYRAISSHRSRPIASVILFLKKTIRRCIKFYIEPVCDQQTEFNNATYEVIVSMQEEIESLKEEIRELKESQSGRAYSQQGRE